MILPRDDRLGRLGRAFVGDRGHRHAGELLQPPGEQVLRRRDAELRIVHPVGILLGVGDQLGKCLRRQRIGGRDRVGVACDQRDADKIGQLVVKTLVHQRVDRIEIGAEQQVVTFAWPRHDVVRRDRCAGPRLVLHHHLPAERHGQAIGEEARRNIGRTASREADHQSDRPRRIVVRRTTRHRAGERAGGEHATRAHPGGHPSRHAGLPSGFRSWIRIRSRVPR